jgi:hypothetical protein
MGFGVYLLVLGIVLPEFPILVEMPVVDWVLPSKTTRPEVVRCEVYLAHPPDRIDGEKEMECFRWHRAF